MGIGAYEPGAPADPRTIDRLAARSGHDPAIISWYRNWDEPLVVDENLRTVAHHDAIPMITWEPWSADGDPYPLADIASGRHDAYIRASADAAARWKKPLLLRFAHEMNGDWTPWGAGVETNSPSDYKRAWRHTVSIFRDQGAGNVRFVWSPNAEDTSAVAFEPYFPGDRWIDWGGLDGFNWGGNWGWRSFSQIFGDSYENLAKLTEKPLMIAETGSNESPGSKPEWITSAFGHELDNFEQVRAVVWFDDTHSDVADFRIDSSAASLAAYREALSDRRFDVDGPALLHAAERLPAPEDGSESRHRGAVADVPLPAGGFGAPSLPERLREKLRGHEAAAIAVTIGGLCAAVAAALWLRRRRQAG